MDEYLRMLIEDYCMNHNSKKSRQLSKLLNLSYTMDMFATDSDSIFLEKMINIEKDTEFKEVLQALDEFLFG